MATSSHSVPPAVTGGDPAPSRSAPSGSSAEGGTRVRSPAEGGTRVRSPAEGGTRVRSPAEGGTRVRSYYVDWLRVLATFIVFLYHSSRPFNAIENWHVKNPQVSYGFDAPQPLFGLWMMPLFFVLSGISTYYALRTRVSASATGQS